MKKYMIFFLFFCLTSYTYFNTDFLKLNIIDSPYFYGKISVAGDNDFYNSFYKNYKNLISGKYNIFDISLPMFSTYMHGKYISNLFGMEIFYYLKNSKLKKSTETLDYKQTLNIINFNFYQNNKIYKDMYGGFIFKFYSVFSNYYQDDHNIFTADKKESVTNIGFIFTPGIKTKIQNYIVFISSGLNLKFNNKYTFNFANHIGISYGKTIYFYIPIIFNYSLYYLSDFYLNSFVFEFILNFNGSIYLKSSINNKELNFIFKLYFLKFFAVESGYSYNYNDSSPFYSVGMVLYFSGLGLPNLK